MPKRDVDIGLELFRTFVAVNEFRSSKKAAAYLGLSPPAISGHLKRLQTQLDVKLLDDSIPGVVLTPDGKVVLETAREIVDRHDKLIGRISSSKSGAPIDQPIKIGVPLELPSWLLVPALAEIRQNHPELQFLLRRGSASALLNGLQNGDLDICPIVTPHPPPDTARCHQPQLHLSLAEWFN
jgi:DNA-binding transcriptional LysR family regulator